MAAKSRAKTPANARLISRLLALPAVPPVPAAVVKAVRGRQPLGLDADAVVEQLKQEAGRVADARRALLDLPGAQPAAGSVL